MRVSDQILVYPRRLAPEQKRAIKAGLRALDREKPINTKALENELEGFYRLGVGKFRIVFRYLAGGESLASLSRFGASSTSASF